jgi:hypothetical protein
MIGPKSIGARGAALALVMTGLLTLLLSFGTWGVCSNTPCGGPFMAISWYSGLDLGFGVVTALAGLGLAAISFVGLLRNGGSGFATTAVLLAVLIVTTAVASVIWMYVIPGEDTYFYWPPYSAILVAVLGLIAFAASMRLRHAWP